MGLRATTKWFGGGRASESRYDGNTARLARRSDEALGVRISVARIAPSLLDLGRGFPTGAHPTLKLIPFSACVLNFGSLFASRIRIASRSPLPEARYLGQSHHQRLYNTWQHFVWGLSVDLRRDEAIKMQLGVPLTAFRLNTQPPATVSLRSECVVFADTVVGSPRLWSRPREAGGTRLSRRYLGQAAGGRFCSQVPATRGGLSKASTKQCRNERTGEAGDPRENPPTSRIVRARFPRAKVRERPRRESNPVRQVGRRVVRPPHHLGPLLRILASHQGESGSIPGKVAPGFSHVVIVPDDACTCQRVFSGISRFLPSLHPGAAPYSYRFTLIGSLDVDVKSRPNLFTHSLQCEGLRVQILGKAGKRVSFSGLRIAAVYLEPALRSYRHPVASNTRERQNVEKLAITYKSEREERLVYRNHVYVQERLAPARLSGAMGGDPPRSPLFLERCARGRLSSFWESREYRQRRDLLASQTSSRMLEIPIRLAMTQECSRRNSRVGEDSGLPSRVCAREVRCVDDDRRSRDDGGRGVRGVNGRERMKPTSEAYCARGRSEHSITLRTASVTRNPRTVLRDRIEICPAQECVKDEESCFLQAGTLMNHSHLTSAGRSCVNVRMVQGQSSMRAGRSTKNKRTFAEIPADFTSACVTTPIVQPVN
ncbi:hypothetical protein PR048_031482 [Dryococelus australis]|uniref:Uncharacterized protein n=1 Tax=Dryococelus australis TaxID=614101 RepID=A0ABQ9G5F0_9NEOP|nr:hypothetical protein PR048_031482 [Dryococelus australis]